MEASIDLHLLACLNVGSTGFGLFDPMERLRRANPVFCEAFAASVEEEPSWETLMRGCHANRRGLRIETDDIEAWLVGERRTHRQAPTRAFGATLVDGRCVWINESLQSDGWLLVVVSDITTLRSEPAVGPMPDQALGTAQLDVLTGLPNRRNIFHRLDTLLSSTRQVRIPLAVAVLEIDHLATIVEAHGVEVADQVLEHFAGQVRRHLRPLDEAGRIGDDGFLLLLPNTTVAGADEALARLRVQMREALPFPGLADLRYDFSAGVAPALAGDTTSDTFTRGDGALYLAKNRGRGCQAVVDPEQFGHGQSASNEAA